MRRALALSAAVALVASGCGGVADSAPTAGPRVVAALGDSITAGSPAWDPDPGVRERLGAGADPESQFEYWAQLAAGRGTVFRNCGVFGERTDQIAARLAACARGARVLIVQGGINDIAQGVPATTAAANLRAMVRGGRARGMEVLLANVLPWNNGPPGAARQITKLNALIDAIGRDEHVRVLDFNGALADPRDRDRMPAALTVEGDHPSVAGYRRLGALITLGDRGGTGSSPPR